MITFQKIRHSAWRRCVAFLLLGAISLLTASAVYGQSTSSAPTDRGLFWKIERGGKTSYLLGTVHVWKPEWLPLNPAIEKAFAEAKTLAVEADADAFFVLNQKSFNNSEAKHEFEDKFLYQRDIAMTRKIEELLRQPGPHFIAVGSLHLVGPQSIVEQLKAKGYRVGQI